MDVFVCWPDFAASLTVKDFWDEENRNGHFLGTFVYNIPNQIYLEYGMIWWRKSAVGIQTLKIIFSTQVFLKNLSELWLLG